MKIILTGGNGQFGQAFRTICPHRIIATRNASREADPRTVPMDLADPASCARLVRETEPDWIVHAAALTNVDDCERRPEAASIANGRATGAIAAAAREIGARMIYISTDYVFNGSKGSYEEADDVDPVNAYGRSKLEGEQLARQHLPDVVIARTSVVFGPHKANFVRWVIGELASKRPIRVVQDQIVTPTSAADLSLQVLALIENEARGIYHTAGATKLSRYDMAVETARTFGLDGSLIQPITSDQLSWVARRPMRSDLVTAKMAKIHALMTFQQSLERLQIDLQRNA